MSLIAVIPARQWSAGHPCKNRHAWDALIATLDELQPDAVLVVTDDPVLAYDARARGVGECIWRVMDARHTVAQAVQAALEGVTLAEGDTVAILQPSSPTRNRAAYVRAAVARLEQGDVDSVVSVVPLPGDVGKAVRVTADGLLRPYWAETWAEVPDRRQDAPAAWRRDGTCYVVRAELAAAGDTYGRMTAALLVDPADSVTVD